MAASNEWTEWHLTKNGWVKGTEKTDFGRSDIETPADRIATYRYKEYVASVHSRMNISWDREWSQDNASLQEIINSHGEYPNDFIRDRVMGKPIKS